MRNVNIAEGQTMQVLRYANRVPLQFKQRDCAITEAVMSTNWRSYGLSQSRGSLPSGPVTRAWSTWPASGCRSPASRRRRSPAIPEIQKELRLGLQAVGRKLGMYLRAPQAGEAGRRAAQHLPALPGRSGRRRQRDQRRRPRAALRRSCWRWPNGRRPKPTRSFDDRGRKIDEGDEDYRRQRADRRAGSGGSAAATVPPTSDPQKKLF